MDKEPDMVYNQVDTTPKITFDHQVISPNAAALINDIMTDNKVDMAIL